MLRCQVSRCQEQRDQLAETSKVAKCGEGVASPQPTREHHKLRMRLRGRAIACTHLGEFLDCKNNSGINNFYYFSARKK